MVDAAVETTRYSREISLTPTGLLPAHKAELAREPLIAAVAHRYGDSIQHHVDFLRRLRQDLASDSPTPPRGDR